MKLNKMLAKAITIASLAHQNQLDKSGLPYILHPLHVMNTVKSKDISVRIVAVLHDVVEDSAITLEDLVDSGFDEDLVVHPLWLLTKTPGESYDSYISNILTNKTAMLVKMADLKHNSDITRLKGVEEKDLLRIAKYHYAYTLIKKTLKELPSA